MELADVQKIRDSLRKIKDKSGNPVPVFVISDNLRIFDERHCFMKWDDDNAILWAFQRTESIFHGIDEQAMIQLLCLDYGEIQYIGTRFTPKELKEYAAKIPGIDLTEEQVKNIIQYFAPTNEEFNKSLRTPEQIEVLKQQDEFVKSQMEFNHVVKPKY